MVVRGINYNDLEVHRIMLQDRVRNECYRKAIFQAVKPGDVVLDYGAGTGILSIFAAQAGASKVYGVERTDTAKLARRIIDNNGLSTQIEILQGDMETIELPEKVDVIVSEWLGGFAIEENMLPDLIIARDRWLRPGGKILPERTNIWVAPAWDHDLNVDMEFWKSLAHGIDWSVVSEAMTQKIYYQRHGILSENLHACPQSPWQIDVYRYTVKEALRSFEAQLAFAITTGCRMNCIAAWFDADFGTGIKLTNAPDSAYTHWGRVILPLRSNLDLKRDNVVNISISYAAIGPGFCQVDWSVQIDNGQIDQYTALT